ncbi:hypothetical protein C1646_678141 [Rhizophagus diaphanus]|nr:hypothetical protein C1646_678141 [Rhizophagus diaphanus] [Rhizophagus sp. MUCL 43196]
MNDNIYITQEKSVTMTIETSLPEHSFLSETDISSRDQPENSYTQTPIETNDPNINIDLIEPNIDKGISTALNPDTSVVLQINLNVAMIDNLFSKSTPIENKAHKAFIPRDSFSPYASNNEIINIIKSAFINDNKSFKFEANNLSSYKYYTIFFKTRDSLEKYLKNSSPQLSKIKLYELTQNNVNTLTEQKFQ